MDIIIRNVLWDEEGQIGSVIGTHTDINEGKSALFELKENEEKFRLLFNKANDAIFLATIDEEGLPERFLEVNDVIC